MTDYKGIADGDPTGDLQAAFDSMAAETVATTPEKLMTYRSIANEVSFAASAELETSVLASMPAWLNANLQTGGIDVNNSQTAALLGSLVTTATADAIIAAGVINVAKYPGLKIGHLADARRQRIAGEV